MLTRHQAREVAFQVLFALDANPDADRDAIYQEVLPGDDTDISYVTELVDGVLLHQADLDQQITAHLKKGWTFSRLTKPDLILLRLGLFEVQYQANVPDRVAVNEAIELAKVYSDEQAAKFVNGILANFIKADL